MLFLDRLLFITLLQSVRGDFTPFRYTLEAYSINGRGPCLGDCVKGWCVINYNQYYDRCNVTKAIAPTYRGLNGLCYSNCGKFSESYDWCVWIQTVNGREVKNWDRCSLKQATVGKEVVKATTYFTCLDECGLRNFKVPWCYASVEWQYCDPENKVILFNYPTEDGDECETPCVHFESYNGCYNRQHQWKKCNLNPKKDKLLTRIEVVMMSRYRPGIFLQSGYKECSERKPPSYYDWPVIKSLRDLVNYYEKEFPSMTPKGTSIESVTMIPINVGTDYFILPLVLRARITEKDLLPPGTRDVTNARVKTNFQKMQPIDDRQTGVSDEYGHMLARMLGGTAEPYNFFPMMKRLEFSEGSEWYYLELEIANFLRKNPGRYVDWQVALTYAANYGDISIKNRPTAALLSVRLYESDGSLVESSLIPDEMYFSNDPTLNCTTHGNEFEIKLLKNDLEI